ncbi:MAG: hypothetical protein P8R54_13660 [Myxococcota bacterium]|nr:hypothetical protein [Myxococcota bacterium]
MILLTLITSAAAECPASVPAQKVSQEISLGEVAFKNMDEELFRQVHDEIQLLVPCMSTPFNAAQATSFWRLSALAAFLSRDEDTVLTAFKSVIEISPGYMLPESIAPMGHPLQELFAQAMEGSTSLDDVLPTPRSGQVYVDGIASLSVPLSRPYLFQMTDESEQVVISQRVQAGQRPPGYATDRARSVNVPLAVTAGISGAIAGGSWYLATSREDTFWDPSTPTGELSGLQRQANTLGTVALSAGVVTLGSGAAAVFVGAW